MDSIRVRVGFRYLAGSDEVRAEAGVVLPPAGGKSAVVEPLPTRKSMEKPMRGRCRTPAAAVGVDGLTDPGLAARGIIAFLLSSVFCWIPREASALTLRS